jgi:acetolactate synthase-1/2/3 large subunit
MELATKRRPAPETLLSMKLSDFVVQFLADQGVGHVFGLTGGAVVHLFDSAAKFGRLRPIFTHHEQAAAFAAQSYARISGNLGACFVTTGPGVTNALTGLAAAWLDSVPCIFISGQTRFAHTARGRKLRQVGTQHLEVVPLVEPMTKYAAIVEAASQIRYQLEKAVNLAKEGRPGPVWLDLPLDLQWAEINPEELVGFDPALDLAAAPSTIEEASLETLYQWLGESKRPLVLLGYGVQRSGGNELARRLVNEFHLPFVTTWGAVDFLPSDHALNLGRPGVAGQRGANLAVQNCDLLIALGSHLPIPVTGTMFASFARAAKIVMVDIDPVEIHESSIPVHLPIAADVRMFLEKFLEYRPHEMPVTSESWLSTCALYRSRYLQAPAPEAGELTAYTMVSMLSELSEDDDIIVVDGGGTNVYISFQTFKVKGRQRMILSTGLCCMGSGLPETIGAYYASGGKRVLCLTGDGSFQLNIQELQTICHHKIPVKIFVTENGGYLSIRQTQKEFLEGQYVGSAPESGMSLPDYTKVAEAYGIPSFTIHNTSELRPTMSRVLAMEGPTVCIIHCSPTQEVIPRQGFDRNANGTFSPRPLEDMAPFVEREEFGRIMQIPPWSPAGG